MSVYAFPRLSKTDLWFVRIGGDGLGNLLFNWARCLSVSRHNGWRMVWPTWKSHKPKNRRVNPYDHRLYDDLFRPTESYVHGIAKPLVLGPGAGCRRPRPGAGRRVAGCWCSFAAWPASSNRSCMIAHWCARSCWP